MRIYLVTLLLCILAGTEVDLFIPSFPEIQQHFGLSPFKVELTLAINLIIYSLSCLIAGNLGDRYGRKPVILWSLAIFVIGSFLCCFATSFWVLLIGRGLQGLGIAAPSTLAYVIISDHYPLAQQQKLLGSLHGSITLAMTFAPLIGSYISLWFHWRGNFMLLLVFGCVAFILSLYWLPKCTPNLSVRLSLKEYLPIFKSTTALLYIAVISCLVADYWIFVGIAPILYMEGLQVPLAHFGFYQGVLTLAFSIMSFSSGYWLKKFGEKACFSFGVKTLCLFCLGTLGLIIFDVRDPRLITGTLLLSSIGALFPINLLYPLMLDSIPEAKGRLSSLQVGSRLLVAALGIQSVSYIYSGSFRPLGIAMITLYLVTFGLGVALFKRVSIFTTNTTQAPPCPSAGDRL